MAEDKALVPVPPLELAGGQRLEIERRPGEDLLRLVARDGTVTLAIHVTAAGPVLTFNGPSLGIRASGRLEVEADELKLHGRSGLELSSGGDITVAAAGDVDSRARIQNITAQLGNVNVKANDDVTLNGERVMVNC